MDCFVYVIVDCVCVCAFVWIQHDSKMKFTRLESCKQQSNNDDNATTAANTKYRELIVTMTMTMMRMDNTNNIQRGKTAKAASAITMFSRRSDMYISSKTVSESVHPKKNTVCIMSHYYHSVFWSKYKNHTCN